MRRTQDMPELCHYSTVFSRRPMSDYYVYVPYRYDVIRKTGSIATTPEKRVTTTDDMQRKIGEVWTCGYQIRLCRQTDN